MLQQTQVKTVIPYWERWLRVFPDNRTLADADPARVLKLWEGLGYYSRAQRLHQAAIRIERSHQGRLPSSAPELLALPGVGPYTAGAVLSIAFNQPAPILDGNVIRVLSRLFGITADTRTQPVRAHLWRLAQELVSLAEAHSRPGFAACAALNQSLMELGALICAPSTPLCWNCLLRRSCFAHQHDLTGSIPNLGPKPTVTSRHFIAVVAEAAGRYLVRQRPADGINARLWEFPNLETHAEARPSGLLRKMMSWHSPFPRPSRLCTLTHSITRYRITLTVFHLRLNKDHPPRLPEGEGIWVSVRELADLPFTAAHRRIIRQLKAGSPPG